MQKAPCTHLAGGYPPVLGDCTWRWSSTDTVGTTHTDACKYVSLSGWWSTTLGHSRGRKGCSPPPSPPSTSCPQHQLDGVEGRSQPELKSLGAPTSPPIPSTRTSFLEWPCWLGTLPRGQPASSGRTPPQWENVPSEVSQGGRRTKRGPPGHETARAIPRWGPPRRWMKQREHPAEGAQTRGLVTPSHLSSKQRWTQSRVSGTSAEAWPAPAPRMGRAEPHAPRPGKLPPDGRKVTGLPPLPRPGHSAHRPWGAAFFLLCF